MTIKTITHRGIDYPYREVFVVNEDGTKFHTLIGVESMLWNLDYEGEDWDLDQKFFYYVEDEVIKLPIKELEKYVDLEERKLTE
jgi:hypothetical protein